MEPYCYNATVNRVVDGDTVILDIDLGFDIVLANQSVRLNGVDTPECRTRNAREKKAGLLAKEKVMEFLPEGQKVLIKTALDKKGKFGRLLGTIITIEGTDINNFLIENNYAVSYFGQSKTIVWESHLSNFNILEERGEM